ncbi:DUF1109 domain-containing protein [Myxococcaceae bacterium GXIMD 01537]
MRPTPDTLLTQEHRPAPEALARALGAAREELALAPPMRRWRAQAAWTFAASAGLSVAVAGVLLALGQVSGAALLGRAPMLALLLTTSAVGAWGALSPRGRRLRLAGLALSLVSAAALVVTRASPHAAPTLPGWVCTASHVGVGLVPLVVALLGLREAAFSFPRALVAGLSVGTTGAFVGELACEQGWRHVAGYHLAAWALVTLAALVVSRSLKPRSFAP